MSNDAKEIGAAVGGSRSPLLLHVFHSFGCGGAQTRFVQLANYFGRSLRHVVIAMNGDYTSMAQLDANAGVTVYPWRRIQTSLPRQLQDIATALAQVRPDFLVTHNWGSIDWVAANFFHRAPHIHIEDGFGPDEAEGLKWRRVVARRVLLRRSEVVVPSLSLQRVAKARWKISAERLHYIPNGIDCARFAGGNDQSAGLPSSHAVPMVGTVAALRPEKNFARLLRAFALVCRQRPSHLTIVGDGPERSNLEALAATLGVADRVTFAGHIADPVEFYRGFDVFALTSDTEQMPYTVLEAMAAGLPVVATDVGDIKAMVADENVQFVVDRDDRKIATKLLCALEDRALAKQVGIANARRAQLRFDQSGMFDAFAKLYGLPARSDPVRNGVLP